MGAKTGIEWTDATWNCWQGCHKVSPGCKNCYMYRDKQRYGQDPNAVVRSSDATFNLPLTWARNPEKYGHIKRVFVDSWSDFFIAEADAWRPDAWAIMCETPQFIYQLLTKRPERIRECLPPDWGSGYPNVWLGVSAENQEMADERIPLLLQTPAVRRFVSCEPLLGPISFRPRCESLEDKLHAMENGYASRPMELVGIDWLIAGGESGPNARWMDPDWARSLRDQCAAAGVAFFFKQWGDQKQIIEREFQAGHRLGVLKGGCVLDGREWKEFPVVR